MPSFGATGAIYGDQISLAASAARTTTGQATGIQNIAYTTFRLLLDVTAASGTTPTLDVTLQTSSDNATWATVGTFAQKTAVSSERKAFSGLDRFVRVIWTIAGTTPSFTFSVNGEAI